MGPNGGPCIQHSGGGIQRDDYEAEAKGPGDAGLIESFFELILGSGGR